MLIWPSLSRHTLGVSHSALAVFRGDPCCLLGLPLVSTFGQFLVRVALRQPSLEGRLLFHHLGEVSLLRQHSQERADEVIVVVGAATVVHLGRDTNGTGIKVQF